MPGSMDISSTVFSRILDAYSTYTKVRGGTTVRIFGDLGFQQIAMSPIAVAVLLGLYFLVLIFISRWTASKGGNADFYIGGRNSPWYLVAYGMIGLSGVTFLSVPGWVGSSSFSYMQMVFGYFLGYLFISQVLLPVYYRMELTSIYGYLERRFGASARLTGSVFFLISRVIGASFRLYLGMVLQIALFDALGVEFGKRSGLPFCSFGYTLFREASRPLCGPTVCKPLSCFLPPFSL